MLNLNTNEPVEVTNIPQNLGKWRLWKISISFLVFLTAYNIFLTLKLMYATNCELTEPVIEKEVTKVVYKNCESKHEKPSPSISDNSTIYFSKLDLGLGRWDNRLRYKLYDNIIVGSKYLNLSRTYQTCLATQSSLEKIVSIIEVALYWNGPISLGVFAASEQELNFLLLYILYLRKCDIRIKEKVSFHLAMPKNKVPNSFFIDTDRMARSECTNPVKVLQSMLKDLNRVSNVWRAKLPYPQNHMRNLARKNCQSKYIFLTDVDIIPSKHMAEHLETFLTNVRCAGLCAYVVPTYELDERVLFPPNKNDLTRLAKKGLARPFHHKVFIYNQFATNFSRWQSFKDSDDEIRVSHPVTNFEFLYEPFYISTDTVPPHDERFVGYGYTRNSQVYEMFVAGYEFLVLSPVFTCHWGLQVKRSRPPWREHQNNLNRKQFDNFKREIFARYNKDPLNMMAARKNSP